jgi:large subunit ribosomal protein L25
MSQAPVKLEATARPRAGKGAARQARREGHVPAVIYGAKKPPVSISVDHNTLAKQIAKGHFTSTVFEITVGKDMHRVIARDVQLDSVRDTPLHADFLRIGDDGMIRIQVPVKFVNDQLSPGLKRGGVLNIVRHDVEVFCPYDKIPPFFEINLDGTKIGTSIHISSVTMPEGVSPTIRDRDFTIATIAGRLKDDEPEATPAAAAAAPAAGGKAAPAAGGKAAPAAGGKAAPAAAAKPAAKK